MTRRAVVAGAAAAAAAALPGLAGAAARDSRLRLGIVGVAGRGGDNLAGVSSEEIVALCDIDDNNLRNALAAHPGATTYNDWRRMLERKDLDAVVVSTPDHMHAPITLAALESGHHVYCEKPLTHCVAEARRVTETARRLHRVTQMGTQIHAGDNYRRVVEAVQSGAIGAVREVHVWVDRIWTGTGRPADSPPVPPNIHWNLWLGVAPERPYNPVYLPATWRGWWDFGGGTMSDMACHHMDLPFWALGLTAPETVAAEGPPVLPENTPEWLIVRYAFPARATAPAVNLTWYNGGKRPPQFAQGLLPQWGDGTLFVGEKGMLLADYDRRVLLPEDQFRGWQPPPQTIPASIGHHREWIEACKTGGPTTCNFDYSGNLTEAVLLGNAAYRSGETIQWDSARLRAIHSRAADRYLHTRYRRFGQE